jgi:hypothetical protein
VCHRCLRAGGFRVWLDTLRDRHARSTKTDVRRTKRPTWWLGADMHVYHSPLHSTSTRIHEPQDKKYRIETLRRASIRSTNRISNITHQLNTPQYMADQDDDPRSASITPEPTETVSSIPSPNEVRDRLNILDDLRLKAINALYVLCHAVLSCFPVSF